MVDIDRLFRDTVHQVGGFAFDETVADVFDDMILRSVPLYADLQRSLPRLADLLDHSVLKVIDLGCSTGTSLIHLANELSHRNLQLVGVDNSEPMLKKCHEKLARFHLADQIETHCSSIQDFSFSNASVVLMNYTLQFVPAAQRESVLKRICRSIQPDGFLIVSEKVAHENQAVHNAYRQLYFDYKRDQGYSDLEISRKRDALENVLCPLTVESNLDLFRSAGFAKVEVMLKWFNFATFICYPDGASPD